MRAAGSRVRVGRGASGSRAGRAAGGRSRETLSRGAARPLRPGRGTQPADEVPKLALGRERRTPDSRFGGAAKAERVPEGSRLVCAALGARRPPHTRDGPGAAGRALISSGKNLVAWGQLEVELRKHWEATRKHPALRLPARFPDLPPPRLPRTCLPSRDGHPGTSGFLPLKSWPFHSSPDLSHWGLERAPEFSIPRADRLTLPKKGHLGPLIPPHWHLLPTWFEPNF